MAENKMKEVAKALGLELGEEFRIDCDDEKTRYVLMEDGLFKKVCDRTYIQYDIDNLITGEWEAIKLPKPILTEKEKEYLSAVIRPFRDRIIYIMKYCMEVENNQDEYIEICVKYYAGKGCVDIVTLPSFESRVMYKGMGEYKKYTLEELGL